MKIVINACYGGFGLSLLGQKEYAKRKGWDLYFYETKKFKFEVGYYEFERVDDLEHDDIFIMALKKDYGKITRDYDKENYFSCRNMERTDPDLIAVVEKLGDKANGYCSKLKIIEIPNGTNWKLGEYDGFESVEEVHQSWS